MVGQKVEKCFSFSQYQLAVHSFDNGYVGKQPVAWEEYCAQYRLKELQESMDRCICHCDVTEILFNPFPNKPLFLRVYNRNCLKTLCEKEKLLVTSNFSFSHSVFCWFRELSAMFIKFEILVFEFGRV